jgi:hypothetical protein
MSPGQHFVQHGPEREEVAPLIDVLPWIWSGDMQATVPAICPV